MKPQTKRVLTWLLIIFVAFMIFTNPVQSADWVHTGFDWIVSAFNALFDFFDALV